MRQILVQLNEQSNKWYPQYKQMKIKLKSFILSTFFCLSHRDINTRDERKSNGDAY